MREGKRQEMGYQEQKLREREKKLQDSLKEKGLRKG